MNISLSSFGQGKRTFRTIVLMAVIMTALFLCSYANFAQHNHSRHKKDNKKEQATESIVREGVINVEEIDKNKDGKVYQDQMRWNVLSDEPTKCPICEMKLKEVTIEKAKENLEKQGYKVK